MPYKLPLKDIVSFWDAGVRAYSVGDYVKATANFQKIAEDGTARISYNLGCVAKKVGELDTALEHYKTAIMKDKHLVAAYVQMGSIYDHFDMFEAAAQSYRFAAHHIHSCKYINYQLLGLKLTVYLTQVLYNQASVEARVKNWEQSQKLLLNAVQAQQDGHFKLLLDTALDCIAKKSTFIPVKFNDELFHPSKLMVENLATVNYLGESEVILNTDTEKKSLYVSLPQQNLIHQFLQDSEEWQWPSPPNRSAILSSSSTSSSSSSSSSNSSSSVNLKVPPPPSRPIPDVPIPALRSKRSPNIRKKINNNLNSNNNNSTTTTITCGKPPPPPLPPQRDIKTKNAFKYFEAKEESKNEFEQVYQKTKNKSFPDPEFSCGECHVTAMFSLFTSNPDILSFDKGDRIKIQNRAENGWFHGSLDGKSGLVPWNCMKH